MTALGHRAGNAGFCTRRGSILLDLWHHNATGEGVTNRWLKNKDLANQTYGFDHQNLDLTIKNLDWDVTGLSEHA